MTAGRDDVHRTDEPLERATRLANAGLAGVEADPENGGDVRVIVMIVAAGRGGVAIEGYDDDGMAEPLTDMLSHLQALFALHGKTLTIMDGDTLGAGPN